MANREKIIKGLECCTNISMKCEEEKCPYWKNDDCSDDLMRDAISLLKEQEGCAKIKEPDCRICGQSHCKYYHESRKPTECKSYIRMEGR